MKICIVTPHFYPYIGGGEKMFLDLVKGYLARGHEVHVVTQSLDDNLMGHRILDGMDIWYYPWISLFGHPIARDSDLIQHIKWCDIVHTSIFTLSAPVSRLAHRCNKPCVLTVHEVRGRKWFWVETFTKAALFFLYEQYSCRQPYDVYHVVSDSSRKDFIHYCGKNKQVKRIYLANEMRPEVSADSSLNLFEFFHIPKGNKVFLYYGRPGKTKGIDVYLKAINICRNQGTDLSGISFCFLLGDEPAEYRKEFIREILEADLQDIVHIAHTLPREDLCSCISQADYVVVPSVTEGFGLSALEASQMGKKIICSNAGSLPEVVFGNCLLFRNRDSYDLALALINVIRHGDSCFREIPTKVFTYSSLIENMLRLYRRLLAENKMKQHSSVTSTQKRTLKSSFSQLLAFNKQIGVSHGDN